MLNSTDSQKLKQLIESNAEAKDLIDKLIQEHQFTMSRLSHEIRNPLTLISSSLQLIEAQNPDLLQNPHWTRTLEDVRFVCSLLDELSSYSGGEHLNLTAFPFGIFLKHIALSFAMSLQNTDIEFVSEIDENLPSLVGDQHKLQEVLLNLLQNAKDAVSECGHILLRASADASSVIVSITDDGCGMTSEQSDTIFSPFTSYKPEGSGLGLAICKRITDSHHGTLTVSSTPGKGTSFTLTIPR